MVEVEAQYKIEIEMQNTKPLSYYTRNLFDAEVLFEIANASVNLKWCAIEDMHTNQYIKQATVEDK